MGNLDWPPELDRTPPNERERNRNFRAPLGATTGDSEFATARLPPGNEESEAVVAREPPHEILGIAQDAPESVVRGAARALKAETHPDGGGTQKEFQRVVDAEDRMLNEGDV